MANEIETLVKLTLNDPSGYLKNFKGFDPGPLRITQTNRLLYADIISCTTADTVFGIGSVGAATQGILVLQNISTTNYVNFGPNNAGAILPAVKLLPNERNIFRTCLSVTYRVQAVGGTCNIFVILLGT